MSLTSVPLDHPQNRKLTHELTDVTPVLAEKWLGHNLGNRNLRNRKVANYARDMRNGRWETTGDSIKFDWNGRLIDGQHRLQAVIDSGVTIRSLVVKGLSPEVQGVLDTNVRRSSADALKFNGHTYNVTLMASGARIANARANGFLRVTTATTIPEMTNKEIVDWIEAHPEFENAAALSSKICRQIGAPPSALAYCIWELEKFAPEDTVTFFMTTAEFQTNGAGDPRAALLRSFNRLKEQRVPVTAAVTISFVFRAWNAWRAEKPLAKLAAVTQDSQGVRIPEPR